MLSVGGGRFLDHVQSYAKWHLEERHWLIFLSLLEYEIQKHKVDSRLAQFTLEIVQKTLAPPRSESVAEALTSLAELVERRRLLQSEKLELGLSIGVLCQRGGPLLEGAALKLQTAAISYFPNWQGISELQVGLLSQVWNGDFCALIESLVKEYGWKGVPITLLLALRRRIPCEEQEKVFERLVSLVSSPENISSYIQLLDLPQENVPLDSILCIHDLLVQFGYPWLETQRFCAIMKPFLLQGTLHRWMISNICSNCGRFLSSFKLSGSLVTLQGLFTLFETLIISPGVEITRVLENFSKLVESSPKYVDEIIIFKAGQLVCTTDNQHSELTKSIWLIVFKIAMNCPKLLSIAYQAIEEASQPWLLMDCPILCGIDTRRDLYPTNGAILLNLLIHQTHKALQDKRYSLSRVFVEALFANLSTLVKVPFSSIIAGPVNFAIQNYFDILTILANICLFMVRNGWRSWKQLINEFSPTSTWIQLGNTKWHQRIIPNIYKSWLEKKDMVPEALDFFITNNELLIATGLLEAITWDPQHSPGLLRVLLGQKLEKINDKAIFSLLQKIGRDKSLPVWSLIPQQVCKSLQEACKVTPEDLSYCLTHLRRIISVINYTVDSSLREDLMVKLLQTVNIIGPPSLGLLINVTTLVEANCSQSLIDLLDMYIYKCCLSINPIFPPVDEPYSTDNGISTLVTTVEFLLTRLTSVVLAKGDLSLIEAANTLSLLRGLIRALPPTEFVSYLVKIRPVLLEFRDNHAVSYLESILLQYGLERPYLIAHLPVKFWQEPSLSLGDHHPPITNTYARNEIKVYLSSPHQLIKDRELGIRAACAAVEYSFRRKLGLPIALELIDRWHLVAKGLETTLDDTAYNFQDTNETFIDEEKHEQGEQTVDNELAAEGLIFACTFNHPLFNVTLW